MPETQEPQIEVTPPEAVGPDQLPQEEAVTTSAVDDNSQESPAESTESAAQSTNNQEAESSETMRLVEQATLEAVDKMDRVLRMAYGAMDRGAVTESLFQNDEEWRQVMNRVTTVTHLLVEGGSNEDKMAAMTDFIKWYQAYLPVIQDRARNKMGYFSGNMPPELANQHRLFDAVQQDVENMQHYFALMKS